MPRSTAEWLAIGKALVDFFGGDLTYADTVGGIDYSVKWGSRNRNAPTDGKPWQDFQKRIFKVRTLTGDDVRAMEKHAAYGIVEEINQFLKLDVYELEIS